MTPQRWIYRVSQQVLDVLVKISSKVEFRSFVFDQKIFAFCEILRFFC